MPRRSRSPRVAQIATVSALGVAVVTIAGYFLLGGDGKSRQVLTTGPATTTTTAPTSSSPLTTSSSPSTHSTTTTTLPTTGSTTVKTTAPTTVKTTVPTTVKTTAASTKAVASSTKITTHATTIQSTLVSSTSQESPAPVVTSPTTTAQPPAPSGGWVALTFDDGPGPETVDIASVLMQHGVPATFFQVGRQMRGNEAITQWLVTNGFHVAAHTINHPKLTQLSEADQRNEIIQSADMLDSIVGRPTAVCLRPPYGLYNATTQAIAGGRGLDLALWNVDTQDYTGISAEKIAQRALATTSAHAVVLMHDGPKNRGQTLAALPAIIDGFRARGYQFIAIC